MKNPKLAENPGSNTTKSPDQWVSGEDPMTGATLSEEAHKKLPGGKLTKADASKLIDKLKDQVESH